VIFREGTASGYENTVKQNVNKLHNQIGGELK